MTRIQETQYDYGVLNDLSRSFNAALGDRTGRTTTQRTQDGMYNLTKGRVDPTGGEMHALMIGSAACLASRNKALTVVGLIGLAAVVASWLAGEED